MHALTYHGNLPYYNRELSWVKFNERVLEEAERASHPLLERLKFVSIFSSNLDEFFMIRVGGLKEQVNANIVNPTLDGRTPAQQILDIADMLKPLLQRHRNTLMEDILVGLEQAGIYRVHYTELTGPEKVSVNQYFRQEVFPVLTPLALDPAHPLPHLRGLGLNLLAELQEPFSEQETRIALAPIPTSLNRFIFLEADHSESCRFLLLEDLIAANLGMLFPNMTIKQVYQFRLTRNADLDISEDEADDLLKLVEREVRKRRLGAIIRLEVQQDMPDSLVNQLQTSFNLMEEDVYRVNDVLAVDQFMQLVGAVKRPSLTFQPFTPALHPTVARAGNIFRALREREILLHHPYESFNPVVELLRQSARDPKVLSIKQTLYRTSGDSRIVQALKEAANNGKEVTALIELKARFDEEANIIWARELEQAGVNVIYGVVNLKTHCKVLLVTRREEEGLRQYYHLSTGNYNEKTAKLYTDIGLLGARRDLANDLSELFNYLTGVSRQDRWRHISVAPINLRETLMRQIADAIAHHSEEQPSEIILVMNSLVDPQMIQALYNASQYGLQVRLIVRGICCLAPGLPGTSENIRVRSIVGRFLEHTRIYLFRYNGGLAAYSSSADLMQRNLNRRVEVLFPVLDPLALHKLLGIVEGLWSDNQQARELTPEGYYQHLEVSEGQAPYNAQDMALQAARIQQQNIDTIFAGV